MINITLSICWRIIHDVSGNFYENNESVLLNTKACI